jgi:4,4'-diaponeurosporenoate glycosyltransferase
VQPYHVVGRLYERLSAITNVVSMMGVGAFTPTRRQSRGAFGPCLVVERDAYDELGGHSVVRDAVLDDIYLAHAFRANGRPVRVLGGRGSVSFRMYPAGMRQLVDGWTKNIAPGARHTSAVHGALVFLWITALLVAVTSPLAYLLAVVEVAWMLRRVGRFGIVTAVLYPLPLATFLFVLARSFVATARGTASWRGRTIRLRA